MPKQEKDWLLNENRKRLANADISNGIPPELAARIVVRDLDGLKKFVNSRESISGEQLVAKLAPKSQLLIDELFVQVNEELFGCFFTDKLLSVRFLKSLRCDADENVLGLTTEWFDLDDPNVRYATIKLDAILRRDKTELVQTLLHELIHSFEIFTGTFDKEQLHGQNFQTILNLFETKFPSLKLF